MELSNNNIEVIDLVSDTYSTTTEYIPPELEEQVDRWAGRYLFQYRNYPNNNDSEEVLSTPPILKLDDSYFTCTIILT